MKAPRKFHTHKFDKKKYAINAQVSYTSTGENITIIIAFTVSHLYSLYILSYFTISTIPLL